MDKTPLISIIIPTYNRAHLIKETINSIIGQTYTNWECLVIDDGSSDNIEAVMMSFCKNDNRIQYHQRPKERSKGGNGARNYGFLLSKGEFINWFDSDDLMLQNHLMHHVKILQCKKIDLSISNAQVFNENNNIIGAWSRIVPENNIINEMILGKTLWQTGCVVWKKASLYKDPFDERLTSSQEWTFHITQLANSKRFSVIKKNTCLVRRHENRIGKDISPKKYNSTFMSRLIIFNLLKEKEMMNNNNELGILKQMFSALRASIKSNYFLVSFKIYFLMLFNSHKFKNYKRVLKILIFYVPFYFMFRKGETYFTLKWPLKQF